MPKSRNRKGHSSKVLNYRKRVENQKKSYEKQLRNLYEKQQQESLEKQISSSESQVQEEAVNGDNIDIGNFEIENNIPIEKVETNSNPMPVEGVSDPSQI